MFRLAILVVIASSAALAQSGNERAAALAKNNATAQRSLKLINEKIGGMKAGPLRDAVRALVDAPRPSFMGRFADATARETVRQELIKEGLLDASVTQEILFPALPATGAVQCFACATGSPPGKHHGYPGGLVEHTAFNLQAALALEQAYRAQLDTTLLDHDLIVAAAVLHDLMKTWTLQWNADGTTITQPKLGTTASHHVFIVAEALFRKLEPNAVIAIAAAHEPAGAPLIAYLRSAAIIAGVDPVAAKVLVKDAKGEWALPQPVLPEAAVNHLSDHDYILSDPGEGALRDALARLITARAEEKKTKISETDLRWEAHRVETIAAGLKLYFVWVRGGDEALSAELKRLKIALLP